MKSKKIFSTVLGTIFLSGCIGVFSACNSGGGSDDGESNGVEITATLTVAIKADSTEKLYFNAFKNAFNKVHPEIELKMQTFADYQQAMNNYIATNSMPDIVWCTGDYHHAYSSTGHYEDLTPYFGRDGIDLNDYFSSSINAARLTSDQTADNYDSVWFMPRDYNRLTIMYNKTIFDAAGIAYPEDDWTWDDFISICRTLRTKMTNNENPSKGLSKYSYPANLLLNDNVGGFTALTTLGGSIVDEEGHSSINSIETQLAYEKIRQYVQEGLFLDPTKSSNVDFARNTLAMTAMVRPTLPNYLETDCDFVPYPRSETTLVGAGCSGYAMSSTSANKEEAWEFLKFIGSEEGQRAFAQTAGCVPVLKSVADDETAAWRTITTATGGTLNHAAFIADEEYDLYLNVFDRKDPRLSQTLLGYMQDCMYACMHETYNNRGSIAGATDYYQKKIEAETY